MIPAQFSFGVRPQLQSSYRPASAFWQPDNVHEHVQRLQEITNIAKELLNELEVIRNDETNLHADAQKDTEGEEHSAGMPSFSKIIVNRYSSPCLELLNSMMINLDAHKSRSLDAASSLCSHLRVLLGPFSALASQSSPWEENSSASKLVQKLEKARRNKRWRKKKRKHVALLLSKQLEDFDKVDQEADKWRAQEIARDIAKDKVESMKRIAKNKANEEKKRLEYELELALVVEKLKVLRSIRIQKMKKQGHFFPEEDDIFLDQVKASVEEEERQATTVASEDNAIAESEMTEGDRSGEAAELSKNVLNIGSSNGVNENQGMVDQKIEVKGSEGGDSFASLPVEYYHYYYGSSNDMGTLIEVRRMWDTYIRPGGSRIPGHWVDPPPPADEVWASYLVQPK